MSTVFSEALAAPSFWIAANRWLGRLGGASKRSPGRCSRRSGRGSGFLLDVGLEYLSLSRARASDRRAGAQGDPVAARGFCSTSGWSTCRCPGAGLLNGSGGAGGAGGAAITGPGGTGGAGGIPGLPACSTAPAAPAAPAALLSPVQAAPAGPVAYPVWSWHDAVHACGGHRRASPACRPGGRLLRTGGAIGVGMTPYTRAAVTAERALLADLEAGCSAPVERSGTAPARFNFDGAEGERTQVLSFDEVSQALDCCRGQLQRVLTSMGPRVNEPRFCRLTKSAKLSIAVGSTR